MDGSKQEITVFRSHLQQTVVSINMLIIQAYGMASLSVYTTDSTCYRLTAGDSYKFNISRMQHALSRHFNIRASSLHVISRDNTTNISLIMTKDNIGLIFL